MHYALRIMNYKEIPREIKNYALCIMHYELKILPLHAE